MPILSHPDYPFQFTAPYEEGDMLTPEAADALNALKLDQSFLEAKARKIDDSEMEEFIAYQLLKAPLHAPALTRPRTPVQKAARKILIARIKDAYREKGLTITGNLAAIEGLANKIEFETGNEQWAKCLEIAAEEQAASEVQAKDDAATTLPLGTGA